MTDRSSLAPLHLRACVAPFPASQRTDASLVDGVRRGEQAAVAAVWDRYAPFVRRLLFGAMGADASVEDLTQEVFLAFLKGASQLRDGAALRGYLAAIATRTAAMEVRRRRVRRWVGLTSTGSLPELPSAPADWVHRSALAALERILTRLSHRRRMAYLLREVEGLEVVEAAAALGISESTLRREVTFARDFVERNQSGEPALAQYLQDRREGPS